LAYRARCRRSRLAFELPSQKEFETALQADKVLGMKLTFASILCILVAVPALAQLAPPNADGITMGHVHYIVKDVEAQKRFWIEQLGGREVRNGPLSMIEMPGVYILFRQGDATGPQEGSVVQHVSFQVKDLKESMANWRAKGMQVIQGNNQLQCFLVGPEGIRVEILQNASTRVQYQMEHIHLHPTDVKGMEAWYEKAFGFKVAKVPMLTSSNLQEINEVPGPTTGLHFAAEKTALAATKGRALDHIGFEVKNLETLVKKLEAQDIKLEAPIRTVQNSNVKIAFLTDPWGTYIELTEGIAPR
jgi:catechol 2,3-dioxygenase-like lactoylglutathione lyase family enzyme